QPVAQEGRYGHEDDVAVEPERGAADILHVVANAGAHLVRGVRRTARAIDLRPSRHARLYAMAVRIVGDDAGRLDVARRHADGVRARPHEGHLACDHVEELGKLIKAGLAQDPPDAGDARIVEFGLPYEAFLGLAVGPHAAKL